MQNKGFKCFPRWPAGKMIILDLQGVTTSYHYIITVTPPNLKL